MLRSFAAALVVVAAFALPAGAAEVTFAPDDGGQIEFTMPSGNVGCLYTPAGGTEVYEPVDGGPELICERVEPSYVTVILGPQGEPQLIEDPGEQSCCGATSIFAYGDVVDLDGFICWSEKTGLACTRSADGVGFTMARAGVELFGPSGDDGDDLDEGDDFYDEGMEDGGEAE